MTKRKDDTVVIVEIGYFRFAVPGGPAEAGRILQLLHGGVLVTEQGFDSSTTYEILNTEHEVKVHVTYANRMQTATNRISKERRIS